MVVFAKHREAGKFTHLDGNGKEKKRQKPHPCGPARSRGGVSNPKPEVMLSATVLLTNLVCSSPLERTCHPYEEKKMCNTKEVGKEQRILRSKMKLPPCI